MNKDRNNRLAGIGYTIIATALISFFGAVLLYIRGGTEYFTFSNDQLFQYDIFYREWYRLLRAFIEGKDLPMYSWNMFLGSDFYSSMTYYCTGDLFFAGASLLLHSAEQVKMVLTIESFLCIFVSAALFHRYLQYRNITDRTVLTASAVIYAFGGWSVCYIGAYMFHRFYALFPLLLIGAEKYYAEKKTGTLMIGVCLLFMQSFYFMYPSTLFLIMYCICREMELKNKSKRVLTDVLRIGTAYLIGMMMSGFILLPAVLAVSSNSRVGAAGDGLFWQWKTYIGLLLSPISSGFPMFTSYNNLFYIDGGSHDYWFALFTGIVLLIQACAQVSRKENRAQRGLLLALLAVLCFRPLASVMHGFSEPSFRWMFILEFYLLELGSMAIDRKETPGTKIAAVYFGLCVLGILKLLGSFHLQHYAEQFAALTVFLLAAALNWVVFSKNQKAGVIINAALVVIMGFGYIAVKASGFTPPSARISSEEVAYYDSLDEDSVYRYYIPATEIGSYPGLNQNELMDFGMMSSKTYNTMYDTATDQFVQMNGFTQHFIDIQDPYSLLMLGTKYWIVYEEAELPDQLHFEYAHPLSDLKAYRCLDYQGFGYTAMNIDSINNMTDTESLLDTIYIEDSSLQYIDGGERVPFTVTMKGNNYLEGNIDLSKDNILMLPVPNNRGWRIYVDEERTDPVSVNGGFIGIVLKSGYHEIHMNFVSPGLKPGLVMSACGFALFLMCKLLERRYSKNSTGSSILSR